MSHMTVVRVDDSIPHELSIGASTIGPVFSPSARYAVRQPHVFTSPIRPPSAHTSWRVAVRPFPHEKRMGSILDAIQIANTASATADSIVMRQRRIGGIVPRRSVHERREFFDFPNVIADLRFRRWR